MKNLNKILAAVFLIGFLSSGYSQNKYLEYSEKLEEYLSIIHSKKSFSGEVLVAKGDEILFQQTIGSASLENDIALEKNGKYRIASITKTFTGTLIAMAHEEGKLDVNDKANKYINSLSPKFDEITIKQLLTHTSGIPHNEGIKDYWMTKSKLQMSTEQVISEINSLDLLFKPGEMMHYSSPGYYLLATVLESVYNDSFHNIFQNKILKPLNMKDSGIVNGLEVLPNLANGYHLISDDSLVVAPFRNYSMLKGAGDMYATSQDLLKWNNSFLLNTLVSKQSKDSIFDTKKIKPKEKSEHYGYGWYINTDEPKKYYHGGGTWGYSTYISMYPKDSLSIIILSNISPIPISEVASDIEKIILGNPFQMPFVHNEISKENINFKLYLGVYKANNQMTVTISESNKNFYAQLAGRPAFEIYPMGNHQFFGKKVDIVFTFDLENQKPKGLKAEGMGKRIYFNRITD